jgi:glycosyltransferase involved in cell wall biosynthesis
MPPESLRVLLFSTVFPPFIADDERILLRHYHVEKMIASGVRALLALPFAVRRNDVVLSWFGSVYAAFNTLLARLLGKPSIIVVAGVDASKDAEIHYGIWLSPWKSVVMRYAFRHADRILVVDPFLGREARRLAGYPGANIEYVPFGFDPEEWRAEAAEREDVVLTVASCENPWRMKKKGVDKLFAAARAIPDVRFRLIGIHAPLLDRIRAEVPPNVEVLPFVPRSGLAAQYRRAKVYCQPSFTEGLPNTLCEAMLCGCIPVGTIAGGIPTAIGDAGYLVEYRDQPGLIDALRRALAAPPEDGNRAAERIRTLFPGARREAELTGVIAALSRTGALR